LVLDRRCTKAASIDLVDSNLPLSPIYGRGASCSADGMRFYVPLNLLAADYSHVLRDRGVTLYAHTADNCLRMHQHPIPCRLREASFVIAGLMQHDTELDPRICYTDTHGFTEVVMATAALLGFDLAPRIKDIKDQVLYKMDRYQHYPHLDPILTGTVKTHAIVHAWDQVVRMIASLQQRIVSPSAVLHRLGSYARQNSNHKALAEIGRVHKTVHILRTLNDENTGGGWGESSTRARPRMTCPVFCASARKECYADGNSATKFTPSVASRCCTMRWWLEHPPQRINR
jgi:TnpA family transposase